jgi:hypothetical protein
MRYTLLLLLLWCGLCARAQNLSITSLEAAYAMRHTPTDSAALAAVRKPNYKPAKDLLIVGGTSAGVGVVGLLAIYSYKGYGGGIAPALLCVMAMVGGSAVMVTSGGLYATEAIRYRRDVRRATSATYLTSKAHERHMRRVNMTYCEKSRRNNLIGAYAGGALAVAYTANALNTGKYVENSPGVAGGVLLFALCESRYVHYNRRCGKKAPKLSFYAGNKGIGLAYGL